MAFEALEAFPALAESRNRLLSVISKDHVATADVVSAVESDVALIIAVLRLANRAQDGRGKVDTAVAAVELLSPQTVQALANRVRTFDFFERASVWDAAPERFRLHALATQHAADRVAAEVGYENRDRLTVTSLLHDVGKLVLLHAYPGYPSQVHRGARTPEERIHQERRELGVDHALVGGVLIRRWGLPASVATPIERHHNPDAEGEAAFIRLADMLAHYEQGGRVSPSELLQTAHARSGLGPEELRRVMYELPSASRPAPAPRRPVPAVRPRARRPAAPGRRQGLQADRPRADALDEHRAHAPAQHLRQARRRRPRPGRADRHRARLAVGSRGAAGEAPALRNTIAPARACAGIGPAAMISITTKSPYALLALTELGRSSRRRPGPDRRAGSPARRAGAVPRAALRRPAPRRDRAAPSAASRAATASPASPRR